MHPILTRFGRLAAYVATWLFVSLLVAVSLSRQGVDALDGVILVVPTFLAYSFVCLSAWHVCRAVPATSGRVPAVVAAAGAAAMSGGVIWFALASVWRFLLNAMSFDFQRSASGANTPMPFLFAVAVTLYLLVLSIHHVALASENARQAERQRLEFQVLTRDAELRALRAQLNPHFLYNGLNSISALTSTNPAGARRMCLLLGDFLRSTLKVSALDRITVAEELALVDAYVDIEQVRYGPRLVVERDIESSALTCRVPPLLLQPLIENAIVHGIAGLVEGGPIRLHVARQGERLLIRVENPRDPEVAPRRHGGVGLENVKRRAQTAFADRARLNALAEAETFRIDLNLPAMEE